jgi:hypothetical protein
MGVGPAVAVSPLDEIRAAGIVCPSCGKNYADLLGGHQHELTVDLPSAVATPDATVRCADGVTLRFSELSFDELAAVVNVKFLDDGRLREAEAFAEHVVSWLP